eukprot:g814.t1
MTLNAYDEIQRKIVIGDLKPNELLSENELSKELGCGRTPVREALQRLKFEGFVEVLPRRGILVTPVDVSRQLDLLETRRPLELQVVKLASRRAKEEERNKMLSLADALEDAIANEDRDRYLEINKAIHLIEAEATNNPFLRSQIGMIHNLSRRFWYSFISDTKSFSEAAKHHAATLRAIAKGDEKAAQTSCEDLLEMLERVTRNAVNNR